MIYVQVQYNLYILVCTYPLVMLIYTNVLYVQYEYIYTL